MDLTLQVQYYANLVVLIPLYCPFVGLSKNSDFWSTSGTPSESSGGSWKLGFILQNQLEIPIRQIVTDDRSSITGNCSGSRPKMRGSRSGPLQHTRIPERSAERLHAKSGPLIASLKERGCKIRISRRTPDFQGSSLLVHARACALVGGCKKPEAIWLSLEVVTVLTKSRTYTCI